MENTQSDITKTKVFDRLFLGLEERMSISLLLTEIKIYTFPQSMAKAICGQTHK